jgi:hypothetical protein
MSRSLRLLLSSCHCPCCAGVIDLVAPALPPALQTGVCPVTTYSQYAGICDVVSVFLAGVFAGVALASLLALRWRQRQHHAVDDAGVVPASSPMTIFSLQSFVFVVVLVMVAKAIARSLSVVVVVIVIVVAYVVVFVSLTLLPFKSYLKG